MPNLKDIRKRIASVKNTQKITKAMKMVAAAKLRRAQQAVVATRPYAEKLFAIIEDLLQHVDRESHPLLRRAETPKVGRIILVTSDRGLCGGFNGALNRQFKALWDVRKDAYEQLEVVVIGRKGNEFLKARNIPVSLYIDDAWRRPALEVAKEISADLTSRYLNDKLDEVFIIYTEFKSVINQEVVVDQLLPLGVIEDEDASAPDPEVGTVEYIYEPDPEILLDELLPRQVTTQVQRALLESSASEQGARMTAMDNATNNASDMISTLTLQYNRARQAAITTELTEIVSGAEAL